MVDKVHTPAPGDFWQHVKRGSLYEVVGLAMGQGEGIEMVHLVVYREYASDGCLWVRPLAEFMDGRFVRKATRAWGS